MGKSWTMFLVVVLIIVSVVVVDIFRKQQLFGPYRDSKSIKKIIDSGCKYYYDGCNSCSVINGGEACTYMRCAKYGQPRCVEY